MDVGYFEKLIDQAATWATPPERILPFLTNEPFADNRIYYFCQYVNEKLPNAKLTFYTNGSLFTEVNLDKLEQVGNIEVIHISLHHSNKEDYEKDLQINWGRTLESVHRIIDRGQWNIRIARVQDGNDTKDKAFLEFCAREFPGVPALLCFRYNWKGHIDSDFSHAGEQGKRCGRLAAMTILADGRVSLCCMDENGEYELGDTKKNTLLEIYNGPKAVKYRSNVRRDNGVCSQCNMVG